MENSEKCCTPLSTNLSPSSCLAEVGNGKDHISFDAAWAKSSSRNKRKTREKWLQSGKKPARKNWDLSVLSDKVGWSVFHPPSHSHHHHYYPHFTPDTFAVELQRTVRKLSTVIERCRRSWRKLRFFLPQNSLYSAGSITAHFAVPYWSEKCFQFDGNKIF